MSEQDEILQKQTENSEARVNFFRQKYNEMNISIQSRLGGKQSITVLSENVAQLYLYVKAIDEALSPTLGAQGLEAKAALANAMATVWGPIAADMAAYEAAKAAFVPPNGDVDPLYPPEAP